MALYHARRGQSLIELLVAIVVGTVMIIAATTVIAPALKSNSDVSKTQISVALGKELLDGTRAFSEGNWAAFSSIATTSLYYYYLNTSSTPGYSVTTGTQTIVVGTSTFVRYFYIDNVCRDSNGYIAACGSSNDPSTKKVTIVYGPIGKPTSSLATYLTRFNDRAYIQTDWAGGVSATASITSTGPYYSSSSNITATGTPGSLEIDL